MSGTDPVTEEIRHGVNSWVLVDYDFDDNTGTALCIYERHVYGMAETQRAEVRLAQPSGPWHKGWSQ